MLVMITGVFGSDTAAVSFRSLCNFPLSLRCGHIFCECAVQNCNTPFQTFRTGAAGADLRTVGVNTSRRKTLDRTLGVVTRKEAEGRP